VIRELCAVLAVSALLLPASARGEDAPVVAVFNLVNDGAPLKPNELERLTDVLTSEMVATGRYKVVPKSQLREALQAKKKESYDACYADACQIEIGQEVAARLSLHSKISRFGPTCSLTLTLYDLKQVAAISAGVAEGGCKLEDVRGLVKKAILAMIGGQAGPAIAPKPVEPRPVAPSPSTTGSMPTAAGCTEGRVVIANHCCWPGQDWGASTGQCIGTPRCPSGMEVSGKECVCQKGRISVGGHCCWPGQDWGTSSNACVGAPECPTGMTLVGQDCVANEVIAKQAAEEEKRAQAARAAQVAAQKVIFEGKWRCDPGMYTDENEGFIQLSVTNDLRIQASGSVECEADGDEFAKISVRAGTYGIEASCVALQGTYSAWIKPDSLKLCYNGKANELIWWGDGYIAFMRSR
jgi:hypothetical protein